MALTVGYLVTLLLVVAVAPILSGVCHRGRAGLLIAIIAISSRRHMT